jgi:hypothetical protein
MLQDAELLPGRMLVEDVTEMRKLYNRDNIKLIIVEFAYSYSL